MRIGQSFFAILACVLPLVAFGTKRLLKEQVEFYKTILQKGFGRENVDAVGLLQLLHTMEGHPKYNRAGLQYITEKLGQKELSWDMFEKLVDQIYGDQISDDPYQPQEIHISLTNEVSSMKAMWVTMEYLEKPFVQFMPSSDSDWSKARSNCAINYTYTVPQKWWPIFTGVIYESDMNGLQPDHSYQYRVGGYDSANQTIRYSDPFVFKTAPLPTNPNRPTKVFTLADHGTFMLFGFETINKMVSVLDEYNPDFVFVAGDLSYAGLSSEIKILNVSKEDEFEHVWDLLGIQNQPVAARIPWMVGNGNHERFYNWSAYTNRYKMPQSPDLGSEGNFWYTFTYGNIQWISISSEHSLDPGSPQIIFLTAALEKAVANRALVPWIVVTLHKPLYCSFEGSPSFAAQLEDILLQYDVDLTITGHLHGYERVHPVKAGQVTVYPTKHLYDRVDVYRASGFGPVHIMQGHAGGMQFERVVQPQPDWSAIRFADGILFPNLSRSAVAEWESIHMKEIDLSDNTNMDYELIADLPLFTKEEERKSPFDDYNYSHSYGFGYITVYNRTHLHYSTIPISETNRTVDEFWIVKEHSINTKV